jgi:hypothetical protein
MSLPKWKRITGTVALTSAIGLGVLLSSQHRVRLIFGAFTEVPSAASLNVDPTKPNNFASFAVTPEAGTDIRDLLRTMRTLDSFSRLHPTAPGNALPAIDDPDSSLLYLEQDRALHCYNVDIAISHMLARQGLYTRLWDLNGKEELGGHGHNVLEVWDRASERWVLIDPYYHCTYVTRTSGTPLSLGDVRQLALTKPEELRIVRYAHTDPELPEDWVISEIKFLAPFAALHANNNFRDRYDHRYGMLMPMASLLDRLPLRVSRAVRTVMLGGQDKRYVIADANSPHYALVPLKVAFAILGTCFLITFIGFLVLQIRIRRSRKRAKLSPFEHHVELLA